MQKNSESEDNYSADAPDNALNAKDEDINNQALKDDVSNIILKLKADSVLEKNSTKDHTYPPIAKTKYKIQEFNNQVPALVGLINEFSRQPDRKAADDEKSDDIDKSNSKNLNHNHTDQVKEGKDKEEQHKQEGGQHILSTKKTKDLKEISNEVEGDESKVSENHYLLASGGVQISDHDDSDISKNSAMRGESESEHDYESKMNEENNIENTLLTTSERKTLQKSSLDIEAENESTNTNSVKDYKEKKCLKSTAENLQEKIHENLHIKPNEQKTTRLVAYGEIALSYDNEFINENNREAREEEISTNVSTKTFNELNKQASITFEQESNGKNYQNEEDARKNSKKQEESYEIESNDIQEKLLNVEQLSDNIQCEKDLRTLKTCEEENFPQDLTGDAQGHIQEDLKSESKILNKIYDGIESQSSRSTSKKRKNFSSDQKKEGESPAESGESEGVVRYIESQTYLKHDNKKGSPDEYYEESSNETHLDETERVGVGSGTKRHIKNDYTEHFSNESDNSSPEKDGAERADDFNVSEKHDDLKKKYFSNESYNNSCEIKQNEAKCDIHLRDDRKSNLPNGNYKKSLHQTEQNEVRKSDNCHDAEDCLTNHQKKISLDVNLKKGSHKTEKRETEEVVDCREIEKCLEENYKKSLIRENSKESLHQIEQIKSEKGDDCLNTDKNWKSDPDGKEINSKTCKSIKLIEEENGSKERIESPDEGEKSSEKMTLSRKADEGNEAEIGKQIKTSERPGAPLSPKIPITANLPFKEIQYLEIDSSVPGKEQPSLRENIRSKSAAKTAIEDHVIQTSRYHMYKNPEMKPIITTESESEQNVEETLKQRPVDGSLNDHELFKKAYKGGTKSGDDADVIKENQRNAPGNKVDRSNINPDDKVVESTIDFSKETEQECNINDKDTKKPIIIDIERKANQDLDPHKLLTNAFMGVVQNSAFQNFEMIDDKINNNLRIYVSRSESNLISRETPLSETCDDELSGDSEHRENLFSKASQNGKEILKKNIDEVKPVDLAEKNIQGLHKNFEGESNSQVQKADTINETLNSGENSNRNGKNKLTNTNKGNHDTSNTNGKGDHEFIRNKNGQALDFEKDQSQLKPEIFLEKPTTEAPLQNSKEDNKDPLKDNTNKKSQNDTNRLNTINEPLRKDLNSHDTSDGGGLGCQGEDSNVLNFTTKKVYEKTSLIPSKRTTIKIDETKEDNLEDSNEEFDNDRNHNAANTVDCKSDLNTQICVADKKSNEGLYENKRTENETNFEINTRNEVILDMIAAVDTSEKAIKKYQLGQDVNIANKSNEAQMLNKTFTKITSDDLYAAFKHLDQQRSENKDTVKNLLNSFLNSERLYSYKVNQTSHFPTNNVVEITKSFNDVLDDGKDLRESTVPYGMLEERCIKKTISLIHIDDSVMEIITGQNENDSTDKENVSDDDADDSLITNAIKLQRNDMIIEKMKQRQESTPKIAKGSADNSRDINNFGEPSVKHIEGTPDTDEEAVVVNNLQREETRENSAYSDDIIYGNGQKFAIDNDFTAIKMEEENQDQTKTFMKSVTIDTAVRFIEPASSSDSFCLDEDTSQAIRRQIMAYSISDADSDYVEERVGENMNAGGVKSHLKHNDFNISIALMENMDTSTETESTIVSAATKIQAGARGYLTRKRLGITNNVNERKASQKDDSKASFGNAAISESLEHLVKNEAAKKIQNVYRHHRNRNQAHVPGKIEKSSERNVDEGNRLAQKRSMLQRGDALLLSSTSSSSSGASREKQTEDKNAQMVKANTAAMMRAKKIHSNKLEWLAMRQNSMPVQIDSELFRVIPKHMPKSYFDVREYDRAAHLVRNASSPVPRFLHLYATYMALEKRRLDSTTDQSNLNDSGYFKDLGEILVTLRGEHSRNKLDGYGMY
ncbi:uncharacterized protein MAL13P1.304 [Glossina fuscipes]|uniref:Uncharacterized protein MAL13P1.304 n=1 Tax=Glossina fuscipes TaxID=7396 RepID=A0A9C5ZF67_9MUSC|nr:uncharacterized protein MAL13P1.304 [Glossina fuscipes]